RRRRRRGAAGAAGRGRGRRRPGRVGRGVLRRPVRRGADPAGARGGAGGAAGRPPAGAGGGGRPPPAHSPFVRPRRSRRSRSSAAPVIILPGVRHTARQHSIKMYSYAAGRDSKAYPTILRGAGGTPDPAHRETRMNKFTKRLRPDNSVLVV